MESKFSVVEVVEDVTDLRSGGGGGGGSFLTRQQQCNAATVDPMNQRSNIPLNDDSLREDLMLYQEEPSRPRVAKLLAKLTSRDAAAARAASSDDDPALDATPSTQQKSANLGTINGVFLPCIQNIFGVIIFIRMVWIVGTAGIPAAFLIVFICCSVTFATCVSLSAVATNGIVPAGGSYFMISRALGPEFGGAVGVLFFLATGVAGAMYITGAVEITLNYLAPEAGLFGDFRRDTDILYHNIRVYGSATLLVCVLVVSVGVKFVSRVAPIALAVTLLSIVSIYAGCFINWNGTSETFCQLGDRIIRYGVTCTKNQSDPLSLHAHFCTMDPLTNVTRACDPFYVEHEPSLKRAVPGMASGVFWSNVPPRFRTRGDVLSYDDGKNAGESAANILVDITTSFTIFVAIYFPSCTGILAGSNRSGDLADAQRSIPTGTIAAQLTTSFVYLSSVVLFGAAFDNLFIRDKFGECAGGQLAVTMVAWPYPPLVVVGSLLSTLGAALQSLTSAPRLLQAIAADAIIPCINAFGAVDSRGEPIRALLLTAFIALIAILIGNLDFIAPILTMFFLMCYMFVNLACTLQSLLSTPGWRPRFRYYHWSLSLTGVALCLFVMFISSWIYALAAMALAAAIYKYIEYRGAEKEWGDGLRGLALSAATFSLARLEDGPPHTKNWRPQLLVFVKATNCKLRHDKLLTLAAQLKAGKGLTIVCSVVEGRLAEEEMHAAEETRQNLRHAMRRERVRGFAEVLCAESVTQGIGFLVQTAGLGGLKHNTVVVGWPSRWRADARDSKWRQFLACMRHVQSSRNALIVAKGIDSWPDSGDKLGGCIDVWWIVLDGGLLMLLPFLLKQHRTWRNCKLRIFTVAQLEDNSIQMKHDLLLYLHHLRINGEVHVVELQRGDISAYTYERTLRMEQRAEILRQLKEQRGAEPVKRLESGGEMKLMKAEQMVDQQQIEQRQQPVFEVQAATPRASPVTQHPVQQQGETLLHLKPDEANVKRMHTAVRLNEAMVSESIGSKLVIVNLPALPAQEETAAHFMEFLEVLTEGLDRVLMVRGSGREVITIYS